MIEVHRHRFARHARKVPVEKCEHWRKIRERPDSIYSTYNKLATIRKRRNTSRHWVMLVLLLCWWRRCGAGPVLCCWFGAWCCWGDSGGGAAGAGAAALLVVQVWCWSDAWCWSGVTIDLTMPGWEIPIIFLKFFTVYSERFAKGARKMRERRIYPLEPCPAQNGLHLAMPDVPWAFFPEMGARLVSWTETAGAWHKSPECHCSKGKEATYHNDILVASTFIRI